MDILSLPFFKWLVLNNGQLEFSFLSCFKWSVLNNGQLKLTFLSFFKWSVLNNEQLEFTFYHVSSGQSKPTNNFALTCHSLISAIPGVSSHKMSPSFYLHTTIIRVVGNTL